jgi:diguanylate cyclase (GGDEF)-like protein/PAS domain S-box-containing protein
LRSQAGWLVVVAIVIASVVAGLLAEKDRAQDREERQEAEAHRVAIALDSMNSLAQAQLRAATAFVENHANLRRERFSRFMETILSNQPMRWLAYIEAVPKRSAARTPLQGKSFAFLVRLTSTRALEGRLLPANAAEAERIVAALSRVHESGLPSVSEPTRLKGSEERYLFLVHPVSDLAPDATGRRPNATAFTVGAIGISDLVESASAALPEDGRVALVSSPDGAILGGGPPPEEGYASRPVVIADHSWELRLSVPPDSTVVIPLLLAGAGLALAGLIAVLLLTWSRRERRALELARIRLEERDRAMRLEAETNRMYRLLAENLTDIVLVTDPGRRITYVSPAAERMLGWFPEEMIGHYIMEFLHEEDRRDSARRLAELRSGAGILTFEHRMRRKDGSYIWAESAVRSIFDRKGEQVVEYQATIRDISERKPLQEQLERLAREDPLTGLANRRQFADVMTAEVARVQRYGGESCLLLIDIDHFKRVNDSYGHLVGDRVLRHVADLMRMRMRASDTLARMGGDEFAAILPDTGAAEGSSVATALRDEVRRSFEAESDLPAVTVSIGIAEFTATADLTADQVFERADLALYSAKAEGRDRLSVYDGGEGMVKGPGRLRREAYGRD